MTRSDPEEYVELVLGLVEEVPWGRVTSYGAIAAAVGGGPRQVGAVMARHGGPVPWWRVVRADGSLPPSHEHNARPHYLEEGTPLRASGSVDMAAAFWEPASLSDPVRDPVPGAVHSGHRSVDNSADPVDDVVEPKECDANPLRSRSSKA
jgi:alkylated DNA nucleotide flippase Atl1